MFKFPYRKLMPTRTKLLEQEKYTICRFMRTSYRRGVVSAKQTHNSSPPVPKLEISGYHFERLLFDPFKNKKQ